MRRVRYALAGVLFALAALPVGVMVVWVLAVGRLAPDAAFDLGLVALLCGVAGWSVLPRRREPLARLLDEYQRREQAGPPSGRVVSARQERLGLEVAWHLPAYTPPHELEERIPRRRRWWSDRGVEGGEVGDRDW